MGRPLSVGWLIIVHGVLLCHVYLHQIRIGTNAQLVTQVSEVCLG